MIWSSWIDGWRRVAAAPAIVAGVFAATLLAALPLAWAMRGALEAHLGRSLEAEEAAASVNYGWWQEFSAQASGLGATFTPSIVGFAATLDNVSSVLDAQAEAAPIALAIGLYLVVWTFLTGGVLDRYARQRRTHAHGFFSACGVFFFRFLRLAVAAGLFYWWMFDVVHPWLFTDWYTRLTRDIPVERTAAAVRAGMYLAFGAVLLFGNLLFDYAKIRAAVEDRRSMVGALSGALRFILRHPARTIGLYSLNGATWLALIAVWSVAAPGAGGAGASLWWGVAVAQLYVLLRLLVKLQFLASQTALFQASLAHAAYTAAPAAVWPESPAAEVIH